MNRKGFTIFEIIIVIAFIFVVGILIVPSYRGYTFSSELAVTRDIIVQTLNQAQTRARLGDQDSHWGVHFETGKLIIFKGSSQIPGGESEESTEIPNRVFITGITDIYFHKFTGLPSVTGQITISNPIGESVILNINEQGVISY